ncbi:MAG: hypothetical protein COB36_13110 [Alphaproteobacteria bacterium]|nr:MAG: hypothetical protein COB36_13110 [Alphaproteobacteria bacterium]
MFLKHTKSLRNSILVGTALSALFICMPASAQATEKQNFDIKPQSLSSALMDFGMQGDIEVFFVEADLKGKTTNGFEGTFSASQAATRLLADAGIAYRIDANGTLLVGKAYVRKSVAAEKTVADKVGTKDAKPARFQLAQVVQEETGDIIEAKDQVVETPQQPEKPDEIIVTGTNIRGVGPVGSQVFTYDREEIDIQGYSTIPEFIQSLPQNFNGGVSESTTGLSFEYGAGDNTSQGTGINLRGLGNVSTLVLLNGQRLAPSGLTGGFVDISMIPLAALDRVEVLVDGASAVYGSDAIGGVVNFILNQDYDGAETRVRYGLATQGGLEEITVGQTFGKVWDKAHGLISVEFNHRNPLSVKDRDFSQDANEFVDLLPEQERRNIFLTGGVELTENLDVSTTAYYSLRNSQQTRINTPTVPPKFYKSKNQHYGGAVEATWDLDPLMGNKWQMEMVGSFSHSDGFTRLQDLDQVDSDGFIFNRVTENLSAGVKLNGSLFNIPGGDVKLAVGGNIRHDSFGDGDVSEPGILVLGVNEQSRDIYAFFGEVYLPVVGEDNRIPGVERLAFSVSGRYEEYSDFGSSIDPKIGLLWSPIEGFNLRGTYGTSFRAPLLSELDEAGNAAVLYPSELNSNSPTGTSSVLVALGNNADLQPEAATLWTAGFDYQPDALPGFTLDATYFNIDYDNRISSFPVTGVLNDPSAAPFTNLNGPDSEFLALIENYRLINLAGIDLVDADATADIRLQNIGRNKITGVDFSALYSLDTATLGSWNFSLNGSYVFD